MRDYSINYTQNNYLFTMSCYYLWGAKPVALLDDKWRTGDAIPPHLLMALGQFMVAVVMSLWDFLEVFCNNVIMYFSSYHTPDLFLFKIMIICDGHWFVILFVCNVKYYMW